MEHRKHSKCLNSNIFSISQKILAHFEFDGIVTTGRCEFCNGPMLVPLIMWRQFTVPSTNAGQSFFYAKQRNSGRHGHHILGAKEQWDHQHFLSAHILKACISDGMGVCLSLQLVACAFRKAPSVLKGKYTFYGPIQVTSFFREGLAYWT